jgi:hypothetical protein
MHFLFFLLSRGAVLYLLCYFNDAIIVMLTNHWWEIFFSIFFSFNIQPQYSHSFYGANGIMLYCARYVSSVWYVSNAKNTTENIKNVKFFHGTCYAFLVYWNIEIKTDIFDVDDDGFEQFFRIKLKIKISWFSFIFPTIQNHFYSNCYVMLCFDVNTINERANKSCCCCCRQLFCW